MKLHKFKSAQPFFDKERFGVKNNTVRKIDLGDDRFVSLIAYAVSGFNDGDIQIEITSVEDPSLSFIRDIRDISFWENMIIITWHDPKIVEKSEVKK